MDIISQKNLKKTAIKNLKKHYVLFVLLCLAYLFLGLHYSFSTIDYDISSDFILARTISEKTGITHVKTNTLPEIIFNNSASDGTHIFGNLVSLEETRGVFSSIHKNLTSTTRLVIAYLSAQETGVWGKILLISLNLLLFLIFFFLISVIDAIIKRYFLEARLYTSVPLKRFFYFFRVGQWFRASTTVFIKQLYLFFWSLTIIGGFIKFFSYFSVPYIVAENPSIPPSIAIKLSREMMNGHKWECFKLHLSFIGWIILNILTLGIVGILFSNPYMEATFAEYFVMIRKQAIEKELTGYQYLSDSYLYKYAPESELNRFYYLNDKNETTDNLTSLKAPVGKLTFTQKITRFLGIAIDSDKAMIATKLRMRQIAAKKVAKLVLNKKEYPFRLYILPKQERFKLFYATDYLKHYSISSIILMFFIFCFTGWIWEVLLALSTYGKFINKGMLHGPWIPIYGTGGIAILLFLNIFRKKPILEFFSIVTMCGLIEYYTAVIIELNHNGQKWWDYNGYFLNIHGRICAEGLLVFGIAGMAAVYIFAPMLDNFLRKIPNKISLSIGITLLVIFIADVIFSFSHPNCGQGITVLICNCKNIVQYLIIH